MRRSSRPRAYAPDPDAPGHGCDMPGCAALGEYRAPMSRETPGRYHWFCLEHVRAYNAKWDYYRGMTPGQIEAQLRLDTAWQRPTWPLGRLGSTLDEEVLRDPLHTLGAGRLGGAARGKRQAADVTPPALLQPLSTLGLDWPVSLEALKERYKQLAKKHHPDANGGDKAAEERLKAINIAYAALRSHLAPERRLDRVG